MTLADTKLIENGAALALVMLWLTQGSSRTSAARASAVRTVITSRSALVSFPVDFKGIVSGDAGAPSRRL